MECGKDDCICCKKQYRTGHYIFVTIMAISIGICIITIGAMIYDEMHGDYSPNQKMAEMCNRCVGDTNITAVAHCYMGTQLNTGYRISTIIQCSLKEVYNEVKPNK